MIAGHTVSIFSWVLCRRLQQIRLHGPLYLALFGVTCPFTTSGALLPLLPPLPVGELRGGRGWFAPALAVNISEN